MSNQKQERPIMDIVSEMASLGKEIEKLASAPLIDVPINKPKSNDEFRPTDRDWHSYAEWSEETKRLKLKASTLVTRYHTRDRREESEQEPCFMALAKDLKLEAEEDEE